MQPYRVLEVEAWSSVSVPALYVVREADRAVDLNGVCLILRYDQGPLPADALRPVERAEGGYEALGVQQRGTVGVHVLHAVDAAHMHAQQQQSEDAHGDKDISANMRNFHFY